MQMISFILLQALHKGNACFSCFGAQGAGMCILGPSSVKGLQESMIPNIPLTLQKGSSDCSVKGASDKHTLQEDDKKIPRNKAYPVVQRRNTSLAVDQLLENILLGIQATIQLTMESIGETRSKEESSTCQCYNFKTI